MTQAWHPTANPSQLRLLGKLCEELGECAAAASRCVIQGIEEHEPETGRANRDWLTNELADVLVNARLAIELLNLDTQRIDERIERKYKLLKSWHDEAIR